MQEYKGHYAELFRKPDFFEDKLKEDFVDQAERQLSANEALNARTGRSNPVDWRFDERETADFAWKVFRKEGMLGKTKIRVHFTPFEEGTDEEYRDPPEAD